MQIADSLELKTGLKGVGKQSDIVLPLCVVGILCIMIMPIPTFMLDLLLSFNITFAIIILLVGMYILKPLDLSSFPSILLIATLFRLALNIASTRIILLNGNEGVSAAGKVISAFGNFVVGGNYFVGLIVFLILVVINFMVITKGAGRIAEVAARFTLDAMPGKQMSIDADLSAGLIDEHEARNRRKIISKEAEYYGAMDGANKFVRGDAIAGILITLVNIIGGLTIGVLQKNMTFAKAAENYTLLTIGDGLVSQIPALVISTAAGIIVSRAGSDSSLGDEVSSQIINQPKAIAIASSVLFCLSIVPGLPFVPFFILSLLSGACAYNSYSTRKKEIDKLNDIDVLAEKNESSERVKPLPPIDTLGLEVGYSLIPFVDIEQNGEILERIKAIRRNIVHEIGIVVPSIHIQDNIQLKPGEYVIMLKGNEFARGELMPNYYLAMNPGDVEEKINGIQTKEPTFGLPATWIKNEEREKAISLGYTVVDLPTVMITHLTDVIRKNSHELLGRQETQQILDKVRETHPKVVEELIPNMLPLGGLVKVLHNLLIEQIPIRDIVTILETLSDWALSIKDLTVLTEYVRESLSRTITGLYQTNDNVLSVITLDQNVEKIINESIQKSDQISFLAIKPDIAQAIIDSVSHGMEAFIASNLQPIVLCSPSVRYHFKKLIERFIPDLVVLSYNDIYKKTKIKSLDTIGIAYAD